MNGDYLSAYKKVLVVGLGFRSGLAAANFIASRGHDVAVTDTKPREALAPLIEKLNPHVGVYAGSQSPDILNDGFDLCVLSPGVPKKIPLIQEAERRGIPVIAEIELASRYLKGGVVAITGTDGKSTTTVLTDHIFNQLGFHSRAGGNIGIPLIQLVEESTDDSVSVVELSSYQLETVQTFHPDAAAFLNLTPDHLDRYPALDDYFKAKLRISMNQTPHDYFVYNGDDSMICGGISGISAQKLSFSLSHHDADAYYQDGRICMNLSDVHAEVLDCSKMQITGVHNAQNAMTALLLVKAYCAKRSLDFDLRAAVQAVCSFKGLAHRVEKIAVVEGRTFINDSKATTVGAVQMALKGLCLPVVLILGGRAKGDDYSRLSDSMRGKVRTLVLVGETSAEFARIFAEFKPVCAHDLDDAAVLSMQNSAPGDVVLLSPACASFDMFTSFEERGDVFRLSVQKLQSGELVWK